VKKFDRVTSILIYLQTKTVVTAQELAERFEVSERTIYRDLRSLENAGVPIGAEAGVGYFLDKSYRLPPVVFTREEGASLLVGAKMIAARVDASTREDYNLALDKIRSVMELEDQAYMSAIDDSIAVFMPKAPVNSSKQDSWLPQCRESLSNSQVLNVAYEGGNSGKATARDVEPIGLYYYNDHWHLIAWCRLREDYRDFRLDRIRTLELKTEHFASREHTSLQDYLERERSKDLHEVVVTPYLDYLGRWLLQFGSGASSDYPPLLSVMETLVAQLHTQWKAG